MKKAVTRSVGAVDISFVLDKRVSDAFETAHESQINWKVTFGIDFI